MPTGSPPWPCPVLRAHRSDEAAESQKTPLEARCPGCTPWKGLDAAVGASSPVSPTPPPRWHSCGLLWLQGVSVGPKGSRSAPTGLHGFQGVSASLLGPNATLTGLNLAQGVSMLLRRLQCGLQRISGAHGPPG